MGPEAIVAQLGMAPHPEGGWYVETYRHRPADGGRGVATMIHFLLEAGQRSHWHKVDAVELWLWHAGSPLRLTVQRESGVEALLLGPDLGAGHRLQGVVEAGAWQSAEPVGGWTLVSCVVAPAFQFEGFVLAPGDWSPASR